jgi:hypothetical protein
VSLLDDFVRMRLYRERASEFDLLAETEPLPEARCRYRIIAQHYRELADREARADKAKMAEHLEMLKLKASRSGGVVFQSRAAGSGGASIGQTAIRLFYGGMAPLFRIKDGYLRGWIPFLYLLCGLFGRFICFKSGL